jgi:hypothetical protein
MSYQVLWLEEAEEELAQLWVTRETAELARIVNQMIELLERDPLEAGESRSGDERILIESPYGIRFVVDPQSHLVTATTIWSVRK